MVVAQHLVAPPDGIDLDQVGGIGPYQHQAVVFDLAVAQQS